MMDKHIQEFYALRQDDDQLYKETFETMIKNIEEFGGSVCEHPEFARLGIEDDRLSPDDPDMPELAKQVNKQQSEQRALAIRFLMGGNTNKYSQLIKELENGFH